MLQMGDQVHLTSAASPVGRSKYSHHEFDATPIGRSKYSHHGFDASSTSFYDDSQSIVSLPTHNASDSKPFKDLERNLSHSSTLKPKQPEWKPSRRLYVAFLTLAVITLMVALDGTSLSVALPIISQKLHGSAIEAFWSGTSFLLCSTIFQPSFASFSHIFGRKPLVFIGLALFTLGAVVSGAANDFTTLLVGRCFQGIGGGGLVALTEIIVTDLVPLRLRGQWFGVISGMWSVGSVTGPVVGGGFAQSVSWRWIFYINLPIASVALVWFCLRLHFKASKLRAQLARVDWIGTVLFLGSTTSLLIPITWGGVMHPWLSWETLTPLFVGIFGLIAFVIWERFFAKEQLIRLSIFGNWTTNIAYFNTTLHGIILWSLLYYEPLYYEAVKNYTPIITGVALFPETFTVAPMAVVTGILITKTKRYRWAIWLGWFLSTFGLGLLYLLDVETTVVQWIFLNLVTGLGMGILFPSMSFAVQASVHPRDLAFAVAMFSFFRMFGQSIGVAIGGTIFQNEMKRRLRANVFLAGSADEYAADSAALVQIIKGMRGREEERVVMEGLVEAYAGALKVVWVVMCGLSGVAGLSSLGIRGYSIEKELETEQGFMDERKDVEMREM